MGHMRPYLVRSAGQELDLDKCVRALRGYHPVLCDNVFCASGRILIVDSYLVELFVLDEVAGKSGLLLLGYTVYGGKVELVYLAQTYLLVHHSQSLRGLCRDNDTSGVAVYPVA